MSQEDLQHTRAERARRGSRRKRDLAALEAERRAAAELLRERSEGGLSPGAEASWESARSLLRDTLGTETFRLWFEPLRPLAVRDGVLYLAGPSRVVRWVERRYRELLESALRRGTDLERVELLEGEEIAA
jgi:hypothetical protein